MSRKLFPKHKGRYVEWFHQINQKNKKAKLIQSNYQKATKIINRSIKDPHDPSKTGK
ncbi:hypothetical protein ACFLZV_05745 [Candidatus Margulisiibacteriota bacterium]